MYILQSLVDLGFYIGFTSDLKARYNKHQKGGVKSTKNRRPFKLIYCEVYSREKLARLREIELKKHGQKREELLNRFKLIN